MTKRGLLGGTRGGHVTRDGDNVSVTFQSNHSTPSMDRATLRDKVFYRAGTKLNGVEVSFPARDVVWFIYNSEVEAIYNDALLNLLS